MKALKSWLKAFGMLLGFVIGIGVYLWGLVALCFFTFHHWLVSDGGWYTCNNGNPKPGIKNPCDISYISNNFHYGLALTIAAEAIFNVLVFYLAEYYAEK